MTKAREEKMKTGRIYVLHKMFAGYEEETNCLTALNKLEALNDALKDPNKVSFMPEFYFSFSQLMASGP